MSYAAIAGSANEAQQSSPASAGGMLPMAARTGPSPLLSQKVLQHDGAEPRIGPRPLQLRIFVHREERKTMEARKFSEGQKAFIRKRGTSGPRRRVLRTC